MMLGDIVERDDAEVSSTVGGGQSTLPSQSISTGFPTARVKYNINLAQKTAGKGNRNVNLNRLKLSKSVKRHGKDEEDRMYKIDGSNTEINLATAFTDDVNDVDLDIKENNGAVDNGDYASENLQRVMNLSSEEVDMAVQELTSILSSESIEKLRSRGRDKILQQSRAVSKGDSEKESATLPSDVPAHIASNKEELDAVVRRAPTALKEKLEWTLQPIDLEGDSEIDANCDAVGGGKKKKSTKAKAQRSISADRFDLEGFKVVNTPVLFQRVVTSLRVLGLSDASINICALFIVAGTVRGAQSKMATTTSPLCVDQNYLMRLHQNEPSNPLLQHELDPNSPGFTLLEVGEFLRSDTMQQRQMGLHLLRGVLTMRDTVTYLETCSLPHDDMNSLCDENGDILTCIESLSALSIVDITQGIPLVGEYLVTLGSLPLREWFLLLLKLVLLLLHREGFSLEVANAYNGNKVCKEYVQDISRVLTHTLLQCCAVDLPAPMPYLLLYTLHPRSTPGGGQHVLLALKCLQQYMNSNEEEQEEEHKRYSSSNNLISMPSRESHPKSTLLNIIPPFATPHARRPEVHYEHYYRECVAEKDAHLLQARELLQEAAELSGQAPSSDDELPFEFFILCCRWSRVDTMFQHSALLSHVSTHLKTSVSYLLSSDFKEIQATTAAQEPTHRLYNSLCSIILDLLRGSLRNGDDTTRALILKMFLHFSDKGEGLKPITSHLMLLLGRGGSRDIAGTVAILKFLCEACLHAPSLAYGVLETESGVMSFFMAAILRVLRASSSSGPEAQYDGQWDEVCLWSLRLWRVLIAQTTTSLPSIPNGIAALQGVQQLYLASLSSPAGSLVSGLHRQPSSSSIPSLEDECYIFLQQCAFSTSVAIYSCPEMEIYLCLLDCASVLQNIAAELFTQIQPQMSTATMATARSLDFLATFVGTDPSLQVDLIDEGRTEDRSDWMDLLQRIREQCGLSRGLLQAGNLYWNLLPVSSTSTNTIGSTVEQQVESSVAHYHTQSRSLLEKLRSPDVLPALTESMLLSSRTHRDFVYTQMKLMLCLVSLYGLDEGGRQMVRVNISEMLSSCTTRPLLDAISATGVSLLNNGALTQGLARWNDHRRETLLLLIGLSLDMCISTPEYCRDMVKALLPVLPPHMASTARCMLRISIRNVMENNNNNNNNDNDNNDNNNDKDEGKAGFVQALERYIMPPPSTASPNASFGNYLSSVPEGEEEDIVDDFPEIYHRTLPLSPQWPLWLLHVPAPLFSEYILQLPGSLNVMSDHNNSMTSELRSHFGAEGIYALLKLLTEDQSNAERWETLEDVGNTEVQSHMVAERWVELLHSTVFNCLPPIRGTEQESLHSNASMAILSAMLLMTRRELSDSGLWNESGGAVGQAENGGNQRSLLTGVSKKSEKADSFRNNILRVRLGYKYTMSSIDKRTSISPASSDEGAIALAGAVMTSVLSQTIPSLPLSIAGLLLVSPLFSSHRVHERVWKELSNTRLVHLLDPCVGVAYNCDYWHSAVWLFMYPSIIVSKDRSNPSSLSPEVHFPTYSLYIVRSVLTALASVRSDADRKSLWYRCIMQLVVFSVFGSSATIYSNAESNDDLKVSLSGYRLLQELFQQSRVVEAAADFPAWLREDFLSTLMATPSLVALIVKWINADNFCDNIGSVGERVVNMFKERSTETNSSASSVTTIFCNEKSPALRMQIR